MAILVPMRAGSDTVADATTTKPDRRLWWMAAVGVLLIGGAWRLRRRRR